MVKFFIENYKLTIVLSLMLFVYGLQGISKMNAEKFPAVSLATATVITQYDGASSEDIEVKITKPIEDEIKEVIGIKDISSITKSGLSTITIRVDMDNFDVAEVMDEIQKKVEKTPGLPTDLRDNPEFTELNSEEMPVFELAVIGDNDKRQRDLVAEDLEEIFEDIEAVKNVNLSGYGEREFKILLNAEKLKENYISVSEVLQKISTRNVNIPGGKLKFDNEEALIRLEGKIKSSKELENFMIRSNFSGQEILLKDIAQIFDSEEEKRIYTRYNGKPATIVTVIKKAGEDAIKLVKDIKFKLQEYKKEQKEEGITYEVILDESKDVQNKLNVLSSNAVTGLALVIFFLLIFLPGKIGLLTALSLPIAVLATFGVMPSFGFNLDTITILALIISIGMLVDNGVVISESYSRFREDGMGPKEAASKAVNDLSGSITISAFTTIAAFLPMLVTKGVMGAFIASIPIVVTASLLFSLGESFFLLPMRLANFAKDIKPKRIKNKKGYYEIFESYFEKLIRICVKFRYIVLILFTAILSLSLFILLVLNKFILFPAEETEIYFARYQAPSGTSVERTDELAAKLKLQIMDVIGDRVDHIVSTSGEQRNAADDSKGGDGANLGMLDINVNDDTKFNTPYTEILSELRKIKAPYLDKLSFEEKLNGPPVGNAIEAKFRSNSEVNLQKMVDAVLEDMKKIEGVTDIQIDDVIGEDEIFINIDYRVADNVGLTAKDIGDTVRAAMSGNFISEVTLANKDINLKVRLDENYRRELKDIEELKILSSSGKLIRLKNVAKFVRKSGAPQIKRFENKRSKTITGNVNIDVITSQQANAILKKSFEKHRENIKTVSLYQGGAQESTAESMQSLAEASILALFVISGLLVFAFNSFLKPIIILTTIPLGLLGMSIAFYIHDKPVSFMALIGVIGLAGMIVNSGIVLISYIDYLDKETEVTGVEVLVQAAVTRLKPVIVTSLTTISGLLPTAYGIGGSDAMLIPMTLAMAWGLTTGTILTLVWVPCAVGILDDFTSLLNRIFVRN